VYYSPLWEVDAFVSQEKPTELNIQSKIEEKPISLNLPSNEAREKWITTFYSAKAKSTKYQNIGKENFSSSMKDTSLKDVKKKGKESEQQISEIVDPPKKRMCCC
jgi:hypothetical protein